MKFKAFSLVELLVAMAIIAVLLGLVGYGISVAQRNSRDTQRRQTVNDIKLGLEDYLIREYFYPDNPDQQLCNGVENLVIKLRGDRQPIEIAVSGPTKASDETTVRSTRYCYRPDDEGGYFLGALLENGEWYDASSSMTGSNEVNDEVCGNNETKSPREAFNDSCSE
jgi:prepilin-type N-terminal cleavage/methylation domain-containing protein